MENTNLSYTGLYNFGNSCYFNSSFQFLKPLFDTIKLNSNHTNNVLEILNDYYNCYYNKSFLYTKYKKICKAIHSNGGQQDSDEAILFLLNTILESPNYIKDTLNISVKYKNLIKCLGCEAYKICNDGKDQIENILISKYFTENTISSQNVTPFKDFLSNVIKKESADDGKINTFKIETSCRCTDKKISFQTVLTEMPKFLIIYINRCYYNKSAKNINRLQIAKYFQITTPESLEECCKDNHSKYILNDYHLYGIVIHSGNKNSGHYYSCSRDVQTNDWYICNDQNVNKIDKFDINNENIQSNCSALLYIKNN